MGDVFLKLFNMSVNASWLILAALLLRLILKKAPKWVHCLLWALVAVRLVMPFSIESIFSLLPNADPVPPNIGLSTRPAVDLGIPVLNTLINEWIVEHFAPTMINSVNPLQIVLLMAGMMWALGMGVIWIYSFITYLLLYNQVKVSQRLEGRVYQCDYVDSPFILGFFRPRIYVPSGMEEQQLQYVLRHERAHLQRGDHLWKPLSFALLSVYWFNPLVWVSYILLCRDIEMACDERVVCNMSVADKKGYSLALLECSIHRRKIMSCPLAFGELGVKERIKGVLSYKKPALWMVLGALISTAVLAVCFLTNPQAVRNIDLSQFSQASLSGFQSGDVTVEDMQALAGFERFSLRPAEGRFNGQWQYRLLLHSDGSNMAYEVLFGEESLSIDGAHYTVSGKSGYSEVLNWIKTRYDQFYAAQNPHRHQWGAWSDTQAATCELAGRQRRYCQTCDASQEQYVPASGHETGEWIVDKPAKEDSEGAMRIRCLRCEKILATQVIPPLLQSHIHQGIGWKVLSEPSCTEVGSKVRLCACGLTMEEESIPALGHKAYREEDTEPTCEEQGVFRIYCRCGTVLGEKFRPANGHSIVKTVLRSPTCTEDGLGKDYCYYCPGAEETYTIPATGHDVETTGQVAATCTSDGWTGKSVCKQCGTVTQEQTRIPASHDIHTLEPVTATCLQEGYTEGSACFACGYVAVKQEVIPKLPHSFEGGICSCGEMETVALAYSIGSGYCMITGIGDCTGSAVVIPGRIHGLPVKGIAADAFRGLTFIECCTIPDSVEQIGAHAFAGCTGLKSIDLPEALNSVEKGTFEGCTALESVRIGTVWRVCENAFRDCSALRSVKLPTSKLREIHSSAFDGCTVLTEIHLPASILTLESYAFRNCKDLTVYYGGTLERFLKVTRNTGWNQGVDKDYVFCIDTVYNPNDYGIY